MLGSLLATGVGALMVAQSSGGAVGMARVPRQVEVDERLKEAVVLGKASGFMDVYAIF